MSVYGNEYILKGSDTIEVAVSAPVNDYFKVGCNSNRARWLDEIEMVGKYKIQR
jgi:hypothetical protein